ncbi:MAG: 2OG-Fe(II) oxygenase, partial [Roseobacter sp.]
MELQEQYLAAAPFPNIAIDDFLPAEILEQCLEEFPSDLDPDSKSFDRSQERFKSSFNPDHLSPKTRSFFYSMNSRPFIRFLENLTGIKGLIPDPYFLGGGFHEIRQGGHLDVHADFNHHKMMDLERRINILIYLNKDWEEEYGGQIELWDNPMTHCEKSLVPLFNRCVIFNTTSNSNHGNPKPIDHPNGIPRRSIALYYYTATWTGEKKDHTTIFRTRLGTADETDWKVRRNAFAQDILPPIVMRNYLRIARR